MEVSHSVAGQLAGRNRGASRRAGDPDSAHGEGADTEHEHINEALHRARHLRHGENQERRRAGHTVHQPHRQRAPAKGVLVVVRDMDSRRLFAGMAVRVQVRQPAFVAVDVKVHTIAPHAPEHVGPKPDEHESNRRFKAALQADTGVTPDWDCETFSDLEGDVKQSIARIQASPFIPKKDSVRGFVYEVETGHLREVT